MRGQSARERLLDAVIEHFTADGLADQSLRRIAEAVGTSHRMLLYHFGSKDGLLLEVVREVEARTRAQLAGVGAAAEGETDELVRTMWDYVADPELAGFERLFFALYGRALQGDEATLPLLHDDIESWLDANAALSEDLGVPAPRGAGPRPARAGGRPRPPARPARHRRPCGRRRRPRGVRARLRRAMVGGRGRGSGCGHERPRLVGAAVAW